MCSVMMGLVALQGIMQHIQIQNATESQAQAYQAQAEAANQNAQIMERQRDMIAEQYAQRQRVLDDKRRLVWDSKLHRQELPDLMAAEVFQMPEALLFPPIEMTV